jgi:hypothetical protein
VEQQEKVLLGWSSRIRSCKFKQEEKAVLGRAAGEGPAGEEKALLVKAAGEGAAGGSSRRGCW